MDCFDVQNRITSYLEGRLEVEEKKEFLLHMKKCSHCREELEFYYTLTEATRQLDEGEITTVNFEKELEEKIDFELKEIKMDEESSERIRFFAVLLIIIVILWFAISFF